jgi:hypothetical protein
MPLGVVCTPASGLVGTLSRVEQVCRYATPVVSPSFVIFSPRDAVLLFWLVCVLAALIVARLVLRHE